MPIFSYRFSHLKTKMGLLKISIQLKICLSCHYVNTFVSKNNKQEKQCSSIFIPLYNFFLMLINKLLSNISAKKIFSNSI